MTDLISQYVALVNGVKLGTMFGLISLDFILGILVSIVKKTFNWHKLSSFLNTNVLQLSGGYFLVGAFAVMQPQFSFAVTATWGIIDATLLADIITKFKELGIFKK